MRRLRNIFRGWLPFAVVVTAFCALAYATVQQSLRQAANDPQIQMAEDTAASLNGGAGAESVRVSVRRVTSGKRSGREPSDLAA